MLFRFVLTCAAALTVVNAFAPASFARLNVRTSCRQMSMADLTERNDLRNVAIIGNYLLTYISILVRFNETNGDRNFQQTKVEKLWPPIYDLNLFFTD